MEVVIYRERKRVKNGWHAHSPLLKLSARGANPDEADHNLEQGIRTFLAPFGRNGTLDQEMRELGLGPAPDGELSIKFLTKGDKMIVGDPEPELSDEAKTWLRQSFIPTPAEGIALKVPSGEVGEQLWRWFAWCGQKAQRERDEHKQD